MRVPAPSSTTRRRCSGAPFDPIECSVGPRKRLIPRLLVPNHNPAPRLFPWRRGNSSGWPKVGVRNLGPTGVKKLKKSQNATGIQRECKGNATGICRKKRVRNVLRDSSDSSGHLRTRLLRPKPATPPLHRAAHPPLTPVHFLGKCV